VPSSRAISRREALPHQPASQRTRAQRPSRAPSYPRAAALLDRVPCTPIRPMARSQGQLAHAHRVRPHIDDDDRSTREERIIIIEETLGCDKKGNIAYGIRSNPPRSRILRTLSGSSWSQLRGSTVTCIHESSNRVSPRWGGPSRPFHCLSTSLVKNAYLTVLLARLPPPNGYTHCPPLRLPN
jgi:hypothetical protein